MSKDKVLGFELIDQGKKVFGGFKNASITLIFSKNTEAHEKDLEIMFSGLNIESGESVEWLNKEIQVGDEFIIKVKETDSISPYRVKEKPLTYAEVLAKMSEKEKLAMKLKQFNYLERKLKSKGLI
ncbi:MAG: hypothetical protein HLUCCX10_03185 [Algoriphagus marincola HL-49]|uniref:Uncharacterized protein n=1 Tax=Algoriphagus marincola HL-49 TaxID=1305737 RepID=A0A0P7XQS1_9BACT|nr:MAG: hypothetical protein HLUCCX10_03185 [Algoriphagus marincola HL-49]